MRTLAKIAVLSLLLGASSLACAKGIFQAEGTVSEVRRSGDTLSFRFTGDISFGFATAPDSSPKRRWRDAHWRGVTVTVQLADWTLRYKPDKKTNASDAGKIYEELAEAAKRGSPIGFSIDNPGLTFSNRGQLTRVAGTYFYGAPTVAANR